MIDRFGRIDVLVNNAGMQKVSPVDELADSDWQRIVAISLDSAFHTIRTCLPGMTSRGWGRIINIASAHGLRASPFKSAYVATKHGVVGLTKAVALEAAEKGVTVNAICPGYVWTPRSQTGGRPGACPRNERGKGHAPGHPGTTAQPTVHSTRRDRRIVRVSLLGLGKVNHRDGDFH